MKLLAIFSFLFSASTVVFAGEVVTANCSQQVESYLLKDSSVAKDYFSDTEYKVVFKSIDPQNASQYISEKSTLSSYETDSLIELTKDSQLEIYTYSATIEEFDQIIPGILFLDKDSCDISKDVILGIE